MTTKKPSLPIQLPLWLRLRDDAKLDNFYAKGNELAISSIRHLFEEGERFLYLWGAKGTGCSHLLQSACHHAGTLGKTSVYLPMDELIDYPVELLENLEQLELVCIDDVQAIAGNSQWEEALFHLFNRIRDAGGRLLTAATMPPRQLPIQLADLQSRLSWGVVIQLHELSDEEKLTALKMRAHVRSMELPDEVARFILLRSPRDLAAMFSLLDNLDDASFIVKRKLTIPFVKETFNW